MSQQVGIRVRSTERTTVDTVCLIGSGERAVRAAGARGYRVLLVSSRDPLKTRAIAAADVALVMDFTDHAELLGLLNAMDAHHKLSGVYSFTERGQVPAAFAAARLGVSGTGEQAARLACDKHDMRRKLASRHGATRFALCPTVDELRRFGGQVGWPVVLKVIDGCGKDGVRLVTGPDEADTAYADVTRDTAGRPLLVEEYHEGPEVSVEAISVRGRHRVLAVTDKDAPAPYFTELGHTMPSRLPARACRDLGLAAVSVLDGLGVQNALSHTELRLTADGPRVIETHVRPGGDRISELLDLVYGMNIYDLFFGMLKGAEPSGQATPKRAAAIRFLTPPTGRVVSISGVDTARALSGVMEVEVAVLPGDWAPHPTNNDRRCGHILAVGDTPDEAATRADRAKQSIRIETTGAE